MRVMAATSGLAILAHPSLAGAFFHADHGIGAEVLLGEIFRVVGADGVIYPNVGGRFAFSEATCAAINANLRRPLGPLLPSFPVPGGGIDVARLPHWIDRYGTETIFLIGGSLYAQPDVARRDLLEAVRRHCDERSVQGHLRVRLAQGVPPVSGDGRRAPGVPVHGGPDQRPARASQ